MRGETILDRGGSVLSHPGYDLLCLLRPVDRLRNAVMYLALLDNIEPTEWPFHAHDVLPPLLAAADLPGEPA